MQWLKASQYKVMPWKNGGGSTREVALSLNDHGEMDWRISIATISQSGPFSSFEGIDRTIALLDGDQVTLNVANQDTIVLDRSSQPFSFAGEASVDAILNGRETTDLNIMTRRKTWKHEMVRMDTDEENLLLNDAAYLLVVFNAEYEVEFESRIINVSRFDTVMLEYPGTVNLRCITGKGTFFVIKLYYNQKC
ncbi:HutD/Ves family protein [Bartonella sp. CB169]|uniref:HutD/Ves family protein n=1 Tax=Bartonella sp. CB169 TaxID=3112257 RepID=UPI00300E1107